MKKKDKRKRREFTELTLTEISAVDRPAQEPALAEFIKSEKEPKKVADTEKEAKELEAAKAEIAELKEKLSKAEKPKPTVIFKLDNGVEVTTESDPTMQDLAKALKRERLEKRAAKDFPSLSSKVAVDLLEAGHEETAKTLEKQQKALKEKGGVTIGDGTPVTKEKTDAEPTAKDVTKYMEEHGYKENQRMLAVRAMYNKRKTAVTA